MNKEIKTIGVFSSGGDSPGMNAALRAVCRTALNEGLNVKGIYRGFEGMIEGDIVDLNHQSVANIIQRGGTFLKTARSEMFKTIEGRQLAFEQLQAHGIDALVCIGGDGSYAGILALSEEFGIPCVGIPGTIDNDIYGTDLTIGYDTAINTALEAIDRIRDTAHSHERIFIVEVMGRHSGAIALDVAIAGGAEAVFIPEDIGEWDRVLEQFSKRNRRKSFSILVVAEGDESGGAKELERKMNKTYPELKVRSTILGHIQRGGSPTARDRILASKLGFKAVKVLLEGKSQLAIGTLNNEYSLTPLTEAIQYEKTISPQWIELANILAQ